MMLIELQTQLIWYGREVEPGERVEMPDDEAIRFIERGYAIPVAATIPIETATISYSRGRQDASRIKNARPKP